MTLYSYGPTGTVMGHPVDRLGGEDGRQVSGLHIYGLESYDPSGYGLCSYGLHSYGYGPIKL